MNQNFFKLQSALENTYKLNLMFLNEYDNNLFARINNLSGLIESGQYTERYFLEFNESDLEFDIFDSVTNAYLYNKQPKRWNTRSINQINIDANNIINLLSPDDYISNITDLTSFTNPNIFDISNIQTKIDIKQITEIIHADIADKHKRFKKINKFIFLGTLLGRHIPKTVEKLNTVNHFVCESNLEIFRLSLFVCDYSLLARNGKSVVFSIMDEQKNFMQKFDMFYYNHLLETNFFKFFSTGHSVDDFMNHILTHISGLDPFLYNYNTNLNTITSRLPILSKKYPTINFSKVKITKFIFDTKPVLYLGAGPSLGKSINWIVENQNSFIIVAMGAALKRLANHNITPDIIVSIDPTKEPILRQFEVEPKYYENSIKIVSANSDPDVLKKIDNNINNTFIFEVLRENLENNTPLSGFSVGETALKALILLNTKDIFILGMDLALDQETGGTHDTSHIEANNKFTLSEEFLSQNKVSNKKSYSLRGDTILVKGNLRENVITTRVFEISKKSAEEFISSSKKAFQKIYNLSDGTFIEGTIPIRFDDLQKLPSFNKTMAQQEIIESLIKCSSSHNDYLASKIVKKNIQNAYFLIDHLDSTKNPETLDDLMFLGKSFFECFKQKCGVQNNLYELLITYYFTIFRYIQYYANDKFVKISQQNLEKLSYVFVAQLKSIINKYISNLKNFDS